MDPEPVPDPAGTDLEAVQTLQAAQRAQQERRAAAALERADAEDDSVRFALGQLRRLSDSVLAEAAPRSPRFGADGSPSPPRVVGLLQDEAAAMGEALYGKRTGRNSTSIEIAHKWQARSRARQQAASMTSESRAKGVKPGSLKEPLATWGERVERERYMRLVRDQSQTIRPAPGELGPRESMQRELARREVKASRIAFRERRKAAQLASPRRRPPRRAASQPRGPCSPRAWRNQFGSFLRQTSSDNRKYGAVRGGADGRCVQPPGRDDLGWKEKFEHAIVVSAGPRSPRSPRYQPSKRRSQSATPPLVDDDEPPMEQRLSGMLSALGTRECRRRSRSLQQRASLEEERGDRSPGRLWDDRSEVQAEEAESPKTAQTTVEIYHGPNGREEWVWHQAPEPEHLALAPRGRKGRSTVPWDEEQIQKRLAVPTPYIQTHTKASPATVYKFFARPKHTGPSQQWEVRRLRPESRFKPQPRRAADVPEAPSELDWELRPSRDFFAQPKSKVPGRKTKLPDQPYQKGGFNCGPSPNKGSRSAPPRSPSPHRGG